MENEEKEDNKDKKPVHVLQANKITENEKMEDKRKTNEKMHPFFSSNDDKRIEKMDEKTNNDKGFEIEKTDERIEIEKTDNDKRDNDKRIEI
eukprot:1706430-Ditylum_brightwellii.AAC.1